MLPIFVLWGNLHGGYVLGVILMGTVIIGEILNKVLFKDFSDNLSWRQIGVFTIFMVSGLLMVLINPFGLDMWKIPFNTVGVETLQNVINEWASPDFHQVFQQPMLWMLLGVFSLIGLSKNSIDGAELIPLVAFSWAALVARRNFGPFAIIAAPIFSKYLASLIDDWLSIASQKYMWVKKLLERMGCDYSKGVVSVPAVKADVSNSNTIVKKDTFFSSIVKESAFYMLFSGLLMGLAFIPISRFFIGSSFLNIN